MKILGRTVHAAVLALLAGCGVGGVLAGSAGGGGGGGGGSNPPPAPTINVSLPGGDDASNLVAFRVRLEDQRIDTDERDPRVLLVPEFAIGSGPFRPMTEAVVASSEGTRSLTLSGEHTFVWNTLVDLGAYTGPVSFRFAAEYEEAEGIRRRFRPFSGRFRLDNRLGATVLGVDVREDSDLDTFPVDLRPDGDGFLVADLGANIVERVGPTGRVDRIVGLGLPGVLPAGGQAPGVARLPLLFGVDVDPAGNLYTTHSESVVLTNRGAAPVVFGLLDEAGSPTPDTTVVPPQTAATVIGAVRVGASTVQLGPAISFARAMRRHPSGAFLFIDLGQRVLAANPQDPASPASTPITLGAVTIAPGDVVAIAGGGTETADDVAATDAQLSDAAALAIGPDGEVYVAEASPSRVRAINTTAAPVTIADVPLAVGAIRTVAGGNGAGSTGDGGPATAARLHLPNGIDVSPQRVLFISDRNNVVVRAANLGTAAATFAETTIQEGNIDTVVGGGTVGGIGSKARAFRLEIPNGVALDAAGNLLVADGHRVLFVNGSVATVSAYGATAGAARVALVYDATARGGLLLIEPRALAAPTPEALYVADRSSIRVMNFGSAPMVFGGAAADPGGSAVLAGGAVTGFAGDGGPARTAAFSSPSALASEGPFVLYVADTGNDRVRALNTDDPRVPLSAHVALGVVLDAGEVATVVGGAAGPLADDGDGLAPTAASLSAPQGLAVSNAGLLFVADTGHHRIRVVNPGPGDVTIAGLLVPAGTIETLVGGGVAGFTPDGPGPWLVDTPTALAADRDFLYFADSGNARIRVLNLTGTDATISDITVPPGEVRTIVGTGVRGNTGDFGLGIDATIDTPRAFALQTVNGERAALYFSDGPQHVVRMVNLTSDTDLVGALNAQGDVSVTVPDASIVTLAGGPNTPGFPNSPGFGGDGGVAATMRFAEPWGIAVATFDGDPAHFFVADSRNDRVRRFGAPPLVR